MVLACFLVQLLGAGVGVGEAVWVDDNGRRGELHFRILGFDFDFDLEVEDEDEDVVVLRVADLWYLEEFLGVVPFLDKISEEWEDFDERKGGIVWSRKFVQKVVRWGCEVLVEKLLLGEMDW